MAEQRNSVDAEITGVENFRPRKWTPLIPKRIPGRDAERNDLIDCATTNDLMLEKGQAPGNIVITRQKDFFYRLVRQ